MKALWFLPVLLVAGLVWAGATDDRPRGGGAASLTPWTATVDADGHALVDIPSFTMRSPGDIWSDDGAAITWHTSLAVTGQIYDTALTTVTPTGTTWTTDWNNGNYQRVSLASTSGNVTAVTFANLRVGTYTLEVLQHASTPRTVTGWPTCTWPNGIPAVMTATNSAVDILSFAYNGTDLRCFVAGQDSK